MTQTESGESIHPAGQRPRGAISRAALVIVSTIVVAFVVVLPAFGFVFDAVTGRPWAWGMILGVPIWALASYYIVGGIIRRVRMWSPRH